MKTRNKKIVFLLSLIVIIVIIAYFHLIDTPVYKNSLSIDINNKESETIQDAKVYFEGQKEFDIPNINPFERVIFVIPNTIFENPAKCRVFIKYSGIQKEVLGEYYITKGDNYNTEYSESVKILLKKNKIEVKSKSFLKNLLNLKPYYRIVHIGAF